MKKRFLFFCAIAVFVAVYSGVFYSSDKTHSAGKRENFAGEIEPLSFQAVAFGVSGKVSDFAPAAPDFSTYGKKSADEKSLEVPNFEPFRKEIADAERDKESALAEFSTVPMPATSISFEGISSNDNAAAYGLRIVPPDPNGDVGPNNYVQAVNALVRVFDKQGNSLTPPFKLSSLFSVLGTPCSTRNDGDPIVLYDALTDRWFLSQFCNNFPPFRQMIAVSKTGDPTGEFFVYEFVMPNVKANDYPKFGIWTDAIYMSTDEFLGSDYAGSGAFAFDKEKLIRGDRTASYIYFDLASPTTVRLGGLLPSDLDGLNPPPSAAPNIFAGYAATEYGEATDAIRLFEFRVNFTNPSLSTFTERLESPIAVAPFDPTSPAGRADILQPAPGEALDSQSDRLMYRAAYRNFGTHESLLLNQTVRVSPVGQTYRAGVRVYELRRENSVFFVKEQATVGDNSASRWMASAAQDFQGNIAVGYSYVTNDKPPGIFYTGKLSSEPLGVFRNEATLISGTGVQTAFGFRWGDYSQMSIDPTDDCSFWLTNQYYTAQSQEESSFGWLTRIGKFRFTECVNAPRATVTGIVTNALNGQPIANAVIKTSAYSRRTNSSGSYGNLDVLPNTYILTVEAEGFLSQNASVSLVNAQILTQNFALEPVPVAQNSAWRITSESCPNNAIEPSETVTLNISFRNKGLRNARNFVAQLQSSETVLSLSPPQKFGFLTIAGKSITRPFTFTVAPNFVCGDPLVLNFLISDGAKNLGIFTLNLPTGNRRIALAENFDSIIAPNLPEGWTTAQTGGQELWATVDNFRQTVPNSAFSAGLSQIGVNELVSPLFIIETARAEISFRNRYDLETTFLRNRLFDGSVLEIKIGDGDWQDIEAAGGRFVQGGYDGTIDSCCQNPLAGKRAWSGKSGVNQTAEFIETRAKMPVSAARKNVQLRWRTGTDLGTAREGQYIDNLLVTDGFFCNCQNVK